MIYQDYIIWAYRLFLGREPESVRVVSEKQASIKSIFDIHKSFLGSREYLQKDCLHRRSVTITTREHVEWAYRLILLRTVESPDVVTGQANRNPQVDQLINKLLTSREYISLKSHNDFIASPEFNKHPKIIYLHIPKTAGKAFEKLAHINYDSRASLSTKGTYNPNSWKNARLIGGHFFYSHYNAMTANRLYISIVRDPIERAVSRFNFYCSHKDNGWYERKNRDFDHSSLINTINNSCYRTEFVNYQCLYLSGNNCFSSVKSAFANDYFIIGTFDQIGVWIKYLQQKLGWKSQSLPMVNVATEPTYMQKYMQDKKLIGLLTELNKEDIDLYQYIKSKGIYSNCPSDFCFEEFK